MKSESSVLQKPPPVKKPSKPLNEKKNAILPETTLKKQKSKPSLLLTEHSQLSTTQTQRLTSPKASLLPNSILSPKTEFNEELFKADKSQLKKTSTVGNKLKKVGLSKLEPLKKELLPTLRSPKNGKLTTTHSETHLNSQKEPAINSNQQSHLTIDLDTSILKTEYETDEIVEDSSILNQSFIPSSSSLHDSKIQQLSKTSNEQNLEILKLKQKNEELQRKLTKMKQIQEENRKKLKERISTFNEEGEQMRLIKEKVIELQNQLSTLQNQNTLLKNNARISQKLEDPIKDEQETQQPALVKKTLNLSLTQKIIFYQIQPTIVESKKQMIDESIMTTFEDESSQNALSFINGSNGSGSGNLEQSILSNDKIKDLQISSINLIPSPEIELIKNSYEEKYQQKILQIQNFYKEGIKNIEKRYKLMVEETSQIVKSQETQISSLESTIDKLYDKLQDCTCRPTSRNPLTMQTDEEKLKHLMEINQYKQKISKKDDELKQLRQDVHLKQIECKKAASELDIERIRFNLTTETRTASRQVMDLAQKQQIQLLVEELKQEKDKTLKLQSQNQKKEELIKKLSTYQNSSNTVNKKIKK